MTLSQAILVALLTLSPPAAPRERLPGWDETADARALRYVSTAADIASAAEDACGDRGHVCTWSAAALLVGVAWHESGMSPDVESPDGCYRGRDGRGPRCDGGRAATLWQLQGSAEERALWLGDRVAAAREALRRAWRSMRACRALPAEERLSAYASGVCRGEVARMRARELHAAVTRAAQAMR